MSGQDAAVVEFIAYVASVSKALGWQAGVGAMETAGSIISYLAKHPEKLEAFRNEGVFGFPADWHAQGDLSWHALNGKVVRPEYARRDRVIRDMEKGS